MRRKSTEIIRKALMYTSLIAASILMVFPLFWMISTSFKSLDEANAAKVILLPSVVNPTSYQNILRDFHFLRSFSNSTFITFFAVGGTLISVAVVAYGFSRINWPGKNLFFFLMLSTLMIPPQALIIPQYVMYLKFGWIGTFNPLIIQGFFAGGASMIFLLRQSMSQIPKELDESAIMDGSSHVQIFWHIVMPLIKAPLATIATFLFIAHWNNLLGPLIYLQSSSMYTLPVYIAQLYNNSSPIQPWPTMMAAAVLTTVPIIMIFFYAQRYILESVVITGLKG